MSPWRRYRFRVWLAAMVVTIIAANAWPNQFTECLFWISLGFTGLYLLVHIRDYRYDRLREKWHETGYCQHCGYPRKGLPPGSRCPECGNRFSKSFRSLSSEEID